MEVSTAPNSSLALTLRAIRSAEKSLIVNAYELTSEAVTSAIVRAIEKGVHVEMLQEGQPVGGFSSEAKKMQRLIVNAMSDNALDFTNRYYFMRAAKVSDRRYRYDHAKYMIVDGRRLLIGSENYSSTGNPVAGHRGNRGWEVFIEDKNLVEQFRTIFRADSELGHGDVEELSGRRSALGILGSLFFGESLADARAVKTSVETFEADGWQKMTSPETSRRGLISLLDGARKSIDLQLMSFSSTWGTSGNKSPVYNAVLAAARRGVTVRVLLNDEHAFGGDKEKETKNEVTVKALNRVAKNEDLDLEAAIAQVREMGVTYIHNKGVLVDGDTTLISSINWNENSIERNREAAVILKSKAIHDYYAALFEEDWTAGNE